VENIMPASKILLAARLNAQIFAHVATQAATKEAARRDAKAELQLPDELIVAEMPKHVTVAVTCKNQIVGFCATRFTQRSSNLCYDMQVGLVLAQLDQPVTQADLDNTRIMYSGFDKDVYYKNLQATAGVRALKFYNFELQNGTYKHVYTV